MKKRIFITTIIALTHVMLNSPILATELTQQPSPHALKFRTTEIGNVEDEKGSNLMESFRDSLKNVVAIFTKKREKCLQQLASHRATLQGNTVSDPERALYIVDSAALHSKVKRYDKKILKTEALENLLQGVIHGIPREKMTNKEGTLIYCQVLNLEFLQNNDITTVALETSLESTTTSNSKNDLEISFSIPIKAHLDAKVHQEIMQTFQFPLLYKLRNIQKQIRDCSKSFVALKSSEVSPLSPEHFFIQTFVSQSNDPPANLFMKEIERLASKVRSEIIPQCAPVYWMAQIIMAYQEEAYLHPLPRRMDSH